MNALANSPARGAGQVRGQRAGAPPDHLRPVHRARGRRGAQAHRRQPARHPAHQLHDARAAHDAAGRGRPARHGQLRRACASSCSTSCTPTAVARAPMSPCSCAAFASASPREPSVHRHLRDDGERGLARGQEPRRRARRLQAVRGVHPESNVIVETLERITDPTASADSVTPRSWPAIDAGIAPTITNASSRRTRCRLGRDPPRRHVLRRRSAVGSRAPDDRDRGRLRARRRVGPLRSGVPSCAARPAPDLQRPREGSDSDERASARSFFAFKLHQFISGAGHAYSTLEPAGKRTVTVDGQQFLPTSPEKRLYPVHFCRECGHEYHPVRLVDEDGVSQFTLRAASTTAPPTTPTTTPPTDAGDGLEEFGFVTLHPLDDADFTFDDRDEDYPENLARVRRRGQPAAQALLPRRPPRSSTSPRWAHRARAPASGSSPASFVSASAAATRRAAPRATAPASRPSRPRAAAPRPPCSSPVRCAGCTVRSPGSTPSRASSSASPTTARTPPFRPGHFNDFLFVSLVRAGFLGALRAAGPEGLRSDELGVAAAEGTRLRPARRGPRRVAAGARPQGLQPAGGREHPPTGPRLPRLVRPAPRLALHQPQPRAARPGPKSPTRARRPRLRPGGVRDAPTRC
jgi:hypothetical protein